MKIYTKTGDKGQTGLIGGKRVDKSHPRLEAYGTADELNAFIGLIISQNHGKNLEEINPPLIKVQNCLFLIGAELATPENKRSSASNKFSLENTKMLEDEIDRMEKELPVLKNFILPGGDSLSATVHVSRTICRRLERKINKSTETWETDAEIIKYINRLSDYFFVLARYINKKLGIEESIWS